MSRHSWKDCGDEKGNGNIGNGNGPGWNPDVFFANLNKQLSNNETGAGHRGVGDEAGYRAWARFESLSEVWDGFGTRPGFTGDMVAESGAEVGSGIGADHDDKGNIGSNNGWENQGKNNGYGNIGKGNGCGNIGSGNGCGNIGSVNGNGNIGSGNGNGNIGSGNGNGNIGSGNGNGNIGNGKGNGNLDLHSNERKVIGCTSDGHGNGN